MEGILDDFIRERAKKRMNHLNQAISQDDDLGAAFQIGAAYFAKLDGDDFNQLWQSRIGPLLLEYMRGQEKVDKRYKAFQGAFNDETDTSTSQNT